MNRSVVLAALVAIALVAAGTIYSIQRSSPVASGAGLSSSDERVVVPNGTAMRFRLAGALSTRTNNLGDTFEATVATPVSVDGRVAIPAGANVSGHVILAQQPGKASGRGQMQLLYDKLTFGGHSYDLGMRSEVYESKAGETADVALVGGGADLVTRGAQLSLEAGTVLGASLDEALRVRGS